MESKMLCNIDNLSNVFSSFHNKSRYFVDPDGDAIKFGDKICPNVKWEIMELFLR
jgi:hypothetical protein